MIKVIFLDISYEYLEDNENAKNSVNHIPACLNQINTLIWGEIKETQKYLVINGQVGVKKIQLNLKGIKRD